MNNFIKIPFLLLAIMVTRSYGQQVARASGVKMVTTAGTKIVLNGGITFLDSAKFISTADSIYLYTYAPSVSADWLDSTTLGAMDITSTGNVFLNGNIRQQFYGKTRFYNHYIRNVNGDTLLSSCEVRNILNLDTGYVYTKTGYGTDSLLVSNPATTAIVSTSNFTTSWVNGRLSRVGNVPYSVQPLPPFTLFYLFPIGKAGTIYAPVKMAKVTAAPTTWTMEYFKSTPFNYTNVQNPPVDHVSRVEYWEISSNTTTATDDDAFVSLSWRGYSRVSATSVIRDSLQVAQYISNPPFKWNFPGGAAWQTGWVIGPDSLSGYVTSRTGSLAFDSSQRRFTLGTYSKYNALPVTLVYFTAIADGNKVRLNWEADNEQDTRTYEIQHSLTAAGFSFLSAVSSRQLSQSFYTDYDNGPAAGWNYYRLKIIDRTGNFTYSPVRAVYFGKGLEQVQIFPNPATDLLHILLPSSYVGTSALQVYGVDGKFISSMKPLASTVQMNVSYLPAGTYILQVLRNDGSKESYRFVKN